MTRRMVITGAGGQVGGLLVDAARRRGYDVAALTRADLDITDAAAVRGHVHPGDLVVNCAAFTNVDAAEAEPEAAHAINAVGPGVLAAACASAGAGLVHISTDYVFSGEAGRGYEVDDPTGPTCVYGVTKLAGEQAVLAAMRDSREVYVVRTSWVYTGGDGSDFVAVMRRLATTTDRVLDVVDDQTGSPTYARDLVSALLEIAAGGVRGPILHVANAGAVSRYEQARAVFAELGQDPERVRPVGTDAVPRPARRPVCSALSMAASVRAGLTPLRPWREALAEAVAMPLDGGPIPSTP
ncbi:MAG TPA: dTDP-4-dehydrorhamnose reductase [Mycobacterium sp.]|nr:dTDP-4-dehydrorhamnose reductase [Mycobacterium sp.]